MLLLEFRGGNVDSAWFLVLGVSGLLEFWGVFVVLMLVLLDLLIASILGIGILRLDVCGNVDSAWYLELGFWGFPRFWVFFFLEC